MVVTAVFGAMAYFKVSLDIVGIMAVLGALGFVISKQAEQKATTEQVKENTNGNLSRIGEQLHEMMRYLAVAHPIPAEVVAEISATPSIAAKSVSGPPAQEPTSGPPKPPDPAWAGPAGTYPTIPLATDATLSTRP